ncbi:MAG: leucine-rich repeat domain-containing protein [Ruminococcaceae bacterium]|nr:leucine-rich repeat domain-containing protein [Oscillospiraceae bacterium]
MNCSICKSIAISILALLVLPLLAACSAPHQHMFGEWTVDGEANCIDGATEKRICDCGAVETRTVPAKGHDFVDGLCRYCGRGPSEGLEFYSYGDGTCSLIGRGSSTDENIIIPAKSPSGDAVTKIMGGGFFADEVLVAIYVPESVLEITTDGWSAASNFASITVSPNNAVYASVDGVLYNKNLTTLIKYPTAKAGATFDIPASVTTIGFGAFANATNLTGVNIPASVQTIETSAFMSCSGLTSITIPDGVTTISGGVFANCRSLSYISLPESITSIEENAFIHCEALTSFTVPSGVTSIPKDAFSNCKSLTEIKLHDKITTIGPKAFYYCSSLKQITIPASVTRIYERAFSSCASLESVVIPYGITTIYEGTFQLCSSLSGITIPESVTKIEDSAFYECRALSSIIFKGAVEQWKNVKTIGNWRSYVPAKGVTCTDGTIEFSHVYS